MIENNPLAYEDYLTLIDRREDIGASMNRVDFYKALVNRGDVAFIETTLKWNCTKREHIW